MAGCPGRRPAWSPPRPPRIRMPPPAPAPNTRGRRAGTPTTRRAPRNAGESATPAHDRRAGAAAATTPHVARDAPELKPEAGQPAPPAGAGPAQLGPGGRGDTAAHAQAV